MAFWVDLPWQNVVSDFFHRGKERAQCCKHLGNPGSGNKPNAVYTNFAVFMGKNVSQANHCPPGHFGMILSECL